MPANPAKKRILCISYDEILLRTRRMLLEEVGFEVTPAVEIAAAMDHCAKTPNFDLIVMDHSMPREDQIALVDILWSMNCNTPVLSVRMHCDISLPEADFSVDSSDGPAAFVAAVKAAVTRKAKAAPG
jgi:CheY-like chemotaxis protein